MRLTRVIAERFGRLESAELGELGPGLNVVLGPNEAGKTSFSALVRHVLYGYPKRSESERGYESRAGKREGRLVFEDASGSWAAQRTEGPHGGQVTIHTLRGGERPDLIQAVTRGVNREAFRVVFGFGLEELVEIEARKGSGADILSPLYAAQVGLATSPTDVRRSFAEEASEIWLKRGSKPQLNALRAEIKQLRRELAEMEADAVRFAEETSRLERLGVELGHAREERDRLTAHARALESVSGRLEELEHRTAEARQQVEESRATLDALESRQDEIEVDERVIEREPRILSLLDDLSLFKERLSRAQRLSRDAAASKAAAASAAREAGLSLDQAALIDVGPATRAGIESRRDNLAALRSQSIASRRAADGAADSLAALQAQAGATEGTSASSNVSVFPAAMVAFFGVAVAIVSAMQGAWIVTALGVVVVAIGAFLIAQSFRAPGGSGDAYQAQAAAQRRAHETAREAERDARTLEMAQAEWRTWLDSVGLAAAGEDPAAVAMLAAAVREIRDSVETAQRYAAESEEERAECEAYRVRLVDAVGAVIPRADSTDLDDLPVLASQAEELVRRNREADTALLGIREEIARVQRELEAAAKRAEEADRERQELISRYADPETDTHAFAGMAEAAQESAAIATVAHDTLATEHATLKGRLDNEGRDERMTEARLRLTGLEERRDQSLERYAILSVAERLMGRTQEFSERERQPEVIRRAGEILSDITSGRYERIAPPGDDGRFRVFDAASEAKDTSELSTGTAQQLYLSVRLALVEQLDDVGAGLPVLMDDVLVNFDAQRREGTARAVTHLARHRQVVFFTCHPEIAEVFSAIGADHRTITLDRC